MPPPAASAAAGTGVRRSTGGDRQQPLGHSEPVGTGRRRIVRAQLHRSGHLAPPAPEERDAGEGVRQGGSPGEDQVMALGKAGT
ncbi:hypothetical protein [Streptomyces rhizosphaericus]|uniref:hypothetical protein n=1 Tax=Streptomyces rhizosphaericus TaxID=114699 RepID=UPI00117C34F8|nr:MULTISPECIES: hypothetical protein [Streptomyces violaceusniger group]